MDLFSICTLIKTNMGASGQHNGNTWDLIQRAVTVTCMKSVTHLAVYYFWMQCEHQPRIDESFQLFLDPEIKGSTIDIADVDLSKSDSGSREKKHKSNGEFANMTSHLTSLMTAQEARSKTMELLMIAKEEREKQQEEQAAQQELCASRLSHWEAKVKVAMILDNKVALKALYEEADKFDQLIM
jgi:Cleft lip and palate transmembrane protein 1 (CLPTM1)